MSKQKTTPHRKEALPDKPGRYRIDHPDTPMPLDVRAWQMWAVHTSDLDAMGFETREAFFLACLEAAIKNLRAENARLREALAFYVRIRAQPVELVKDFGNTAEAALEWKP